MSSKNIAVQKQTVRRDSERREQVALPNGAGSGNRNSA